MIPRLDVQVSGAFQSLPGPAISAFYFASNAIIAPSLGRNLSGGFTNTMINLIAPGTMYGDRINQLDLRFGRVLTFGKMRTVLNVDLYNALNANPVLAENSNYQLWRQPQTILMARFLKFGVQLDF